MTSSVQPTLSEWLRSKDDFKDPSSSNSSLPALYADLASHRNSNRSSFESSLAWWKELLRSACLAGVLGHSNLHSSSKGDPIQANSIDRLILHVNQNLLDGLTIEEVGRPLGLGTVVMDLQQRRELIQLSNFLSTRTSIRRPDSTSLKPNSSHTLSSRATQLAIAPITWAISQISLNLGLGEQNDDTGELDWERAKGDWVVYENVERISDLILSIHFSSSTLSSIDHLFSRSMFIEKLVKPAFESALSSSSFSGQFYPSEKDVNVLLKHLSRDRGVAIIDQDVIKFIQDQDISLKDGIRISEHEKGIVNVRETYLKLEGQIKEIEGRIKERQSRAEKCLKENLGQSGKSQALSYLRSKKMLETLLEKRVSTLERLHEVLLKIEQAAGDVEIMKAYEISTNSLKTLLQNEHLQTDRINENMDQMQETLANADEVRQAIDIGQQGMRQAGGVVEPDEDEMEAELAALQKEVESEKQSEKEQKSQKSSQEALQNAPIAPSSEIKSQTSTKTEDKQIDQERIPAASS